MRRLLVLVASIGFAATLSATGQAQATGAPLVTYVVTFPTPPTPTDLEVLSGVALSVHGFEHIPAAVVVVDPLDLDLLAQLPRVASVSPNLPLERQLAQSTRTIRADR